MSATLPRWCAVSTGRSPLRFRAAWFAWRDDSNATISQAFSSSPVWKPKFYGALVLNHRVVLHDIDATPARRRGDVGSSPLDRARTAASSPRSAPDTLVDFHTGQDVVEELQVVRAAVAPQFEEPVVLVGLRDLVLFRVRQVEVIVR